MVCQGRGGGEYKGNRGIMVKEGWNGGIVTVGAVVVMVAMGWWNGG